MHKTFLRLAAVAVMACLPVCAALAASTETAVITAKAKLSGYILPNFHGTQTAYTQADRRAMDMHIKMDSWWARYLVGDLHDSDIFRLDQKRVYRVYFDKKQYRSCDLAGCPTLLAGLKQQADTKGDSGKSDDQPQTYDPEGTDQCPLNLTRQDFDVRDTGEKKTLNGFAVHHYVAEWTTVFEDKQHAKDVNQIHMDFWTTPEDAQLKKVWAIHQQLTDRYIAESHRKDEPLEHYLPEDIFRAVEAVTGDTRNRGDNAYERKFATIQGYPIEVGLTWRVKADACQPDKPAKPKKKKHGFSLSNPFGSLKSMAEDAVDKEVNKQIQKRFVPDPNDPVFQYTYQVTGVEVKPVEDSVFNVPAGFKKVEMPKPDAGS